MTSTTFDKHHSITSERPTRIGTSLLATDASLALTVLRVALGLVILPHGLQKTVGWFGGYGFSATIDYFGSIGIPTFLAFLAIAAESAGALALITGLLTRVGAFGVGVTMLVAAFMHRANGFFMNWSGTQGGEGFEYHVLAIAMAVAVMIGGGGRWSVDRFVTKQKF